MRSVACHWGILLEMHMAKSRFVLYSEPLVSANRNYEEEPMGSRIDIRIL